MEIIIAVAAILLFSAATVLLTKHLTGWARIEKLYRVRRRPELKLDSQIVFVAVESRLDPGNFLGRFNRMFWVGATETSLYIAPIFPVYLLIHPVLIPWTDITVTGWARSDLSLTKLDRVTIALQPEFARRLTSHFESRAA